MPLCAHGVVVTMPDVGRYRVSSAITTAATALPIRPFRVRHVTLPIPLWRFRAGVLDLNTLYHKWATMSTIILTMQ